jgi:hypothetical protein
MTKNKYIWIFKQKKEYSKTWKSNLKLVKLDFMIKWKKIYLKMEKNNVDFAISNLLIVKIKNKLEQLISQWQDLWDVVIAKKDGEIDWVSNYI